MPSTWVATDCKDRQAMRLPSYLPKLLALSYSPDGSRWQASELCANLQQAIICFLLISASISKSYCSP